MVRGLEATFYRGGTVLDIGCGVGAVHFELLKGGAKSATGIDMAHGMIEKAKSIAQRLGFHDQTSYIIGDVVQEAEKIVPADITILDKVVCCYDDVYTLLETAIQKTKKILVISHPRNVWWIRLGCNVQEAIFGLFPNLFHPFWYEWSDAYAYVHSSGFEKIFSDSTIMWEVVIFEKSVV